MVNLHGHMNRNTLAWSAVGFRVALATPIRPPLEENANWQPIYLNVFLFNLWVKECFDGFDLCRQGDTGSQQSGGSGGPGLRLDIEKPLLDRPPIQEHIRPEARR